MILSRLFYSNNPGGLSQKQPNSIIPYLIRNLYNVKIRLLWIPAFAGMIWNLTFETAPHSMMETKVGLF